MVLRKRTARPRRPCRHRGRNKMVDLYGILGVRPTARVDEIKSAYRERAKRMHPDRSGHSEQFIALHHAYELLMDPARRDQYDTERRAWMRSQGAVGCTECGQANVVTRRPGPGQK